MRRTSLIDAGVRWGSAFAISVSTIACGDDSSPADTNDGTGGIMTASASATDSGTDSAGTDSAGTDTTDPTGESQSGTESTTDGTSGPSSDTDSTTTSPGTGSTTEPDEVELLFLAVEPADVVMEVDIGEVATQDFIVTGHYDDGSMLDVTDQVTWTVEVPGVGSMAGATFSNEAKNEVFFDTTLLTAQWEGKEGLAQVTLAAYQKSGATPDFFFVLPYEDPGGSQEKQLTFSTDVKSLDVFFNMDTTGSMFEEIENLQQTLTSTVIPGIQNQVPDTWFGVGAYEDFPISPFGAENCFITGTPDQPFELFSELTDDALSVQTALNSLSVGAQPIGCGGDLPESHLEALYQIATGEGLAGPGATFVASNNSGIGGAGFREGSFPVIVSVTDAMTQDPDSVACDSAYPYNQDVVLVTHRWVDVFSSMEDMCGRVVTVATDSDPACGPLPDGTTLAEGTGAVIPPEAWDEAPGGRPAGCGADQCCTGTNGQGVAPNGDGLCPMVYRASSNGTGVSQAIVDGIQMLAAYSPFTVTTEVTGETTDVDDQPLPAGFTTADFIKSVVPFDHGAVPLPGVPDPTLTADSFENVIPNTDVTFTIEAYNDFVPQGPEPRLFSARIAVLADACSDLDEREVLILVPPQELPPPG